MPTPRLLAPLFAAALIAGCGGGNSNTLYVSVDYAAPYAELFKLSVIQPTLTGFEGHAQRCDQESGQTPPGMAINDDCTITGRPTQTGTFTFGYKVRAENYDGHIDQTVAVTVSGPTLSYGAFNSVAVFSMVNLTPSLGSWTAPTDIPITWAYTITNGALPPGLTLNRQPARSRASRARSARTPRPFRRSSRPPMAAATPSR